MGSVTTKIVIGIAAAVSAATLSSCGSSGFPGQIKVNVSDLTGEHIESSDGGATCTSDDFNDSTFILKNNEGKLLTIGSAGTGTSSNPITLEGKKFLLKCNGIPVNFDDVPAGEGPYQLEINGTSPKAITQQQLESGDFTVGYNH